MNISACLTPDVFQFKSNFLLKCTNRPNNARQRILNFDKYHLQHFPTSFKSNFCWLIFFSQRVWSQYQLHEFWLKKFKWFCSIGQFVSSISKTNIHPGQLSQRELLSSYLGNESPKTAFAFSTKSHKQIEGKQREMSKSQQKKTV